MMGDLCVAKMLPPAGARHLGGPAAEPPSSDRSVHCEASRNLRWMINNTGIHAPVYKLMLPNPDAPGNDQPLFQISKPNPNAQWWSMFYFTYGGHLIPPKRIEFGRIQKNAVAGNGGGAGTRVTIMGRTPEEKAVWQTLGEGNEDMVEWIVLCAALNLIDEEIVKAASRQPESQPTTPVIERPVTYAPQRPTGPARPQGAPVGRPQGVPLGRPQGAPVGRPQGAPIGRPQAPAGWPPAQPGGRPPAPGQPAVRPGGAPLAVGRSLPTSARGPSAPPGLKPEPKKGGMMRLLKRS